MSNETQINLAGGSGLDNRVTIVERDVKALTENVSREFADVRKDGDARHLDLKGMIQGLANAQAERSKVPWQAIGVIVGILGVAGGLVYSPIKERQGEMAESIHDRVTHNEFMTTLTAIGARRDDAQRTLESRIGRNEGDIDAMQKAVVPRGEHEAHWADQRDRDATMQREIETLIHPGSPSRH